VSSDFVAAIDLGSNSFHMIVARIVNGHVQVLDRLREMVQLAAGLDGRNRLSADSQQRALECLARFGQRLRHIPPARLRIVGTNTLRQARNSAEFITAPSRSSGTGSKSSAARRRHG
jgi:exopolyphosphatase/guanosine-5'-triphosphate,3'-diphosphate pyrophosphatase